ncbi:MAG: PQQ-like beta-propeller repeat protein, partial [Brachybacterium sp.]|nr:PQQ-like beta-propeller repeat protein [Brachybacterium sp.]
TAAASDGAFPSQTFEGTPLARAGDRIVLRSCTDGFCRLSGYDLTAPEEPLWVISAPAETRGADPAGVEVPARHEQAPGLLDAPRTTGVMASIPLSFDPGQGWVQLDLATGFPVGRILAGPEDGCRIAVTGDAVDAADPLHPSSLVLTVCSAEDGALTATAFRDGAELWESALSPAGTWSVRLDRGRVLATGTETDSAADGEIIATEQQADWTAPGGEGVEQVAAFTTRIGIDGAAMVVTNESGQLLAYELADGANTWTLPLSSPGTEVRGTLDAGTAVVLDGVQRERPLEPRSTRRLRVIDAATGDVTFEAHVAEEIDAVRAVGGGRALVTVDGETLLLGA